MKRFNSIVNTIFFFLYFFHFIYLIVFLQVKQLETTVHVQTILLDKLSTKLEFETDKRIEMEKELQKIMELVTRV